MPRANTKRPPRTLIAKQCGACHGDFETTRPKATRCPSCITEGNKVRYRKCFECDTQFILFDETHINCATCAAEMGLEPFELSPEQIERLREQEKIAKFVEQKNRLLGWLDRRDKAGASCRPQPCKQYNLSTLGLT